MKVLIVGAAGMLGQAVQRAFQENELLCWDRNECDIADPKSTGLVVAAQPELIINTAAMTAVDACEADEAAANAVNGHGVEHLARAACALDIPIIHFSTDYVFDGTNAAGYADNAAPGPLNAYGRSKLLGEQLLERHATKWFLIRTSYLYGLAGRNIVETFINLGKTKSELTILVDQFSKTTYANDLAVATEALLSRGAPWGIYHLVNEGTITWMDFVSTLYALVGLESKLKPVTMKEYIRPAHRPQYSALVNTKQPPLRHWEEALTAYLAERNQPATLE